MPRLGIDARKLADYGIGSYLQGLLTEFARIDPPGGIAVLVESEHRDLLPEVPDSWRIVEVNAPGYSVREQLTVPAAAMRAGISLLHVPHYVVPFGFPGRIVVTIHDIIHVLFPEFVPSTLGFAYARFAIRAAVWRARLVLTGSQSTASDLRQLFGASERKLRVIAHGLHPDFLADGDARVDEDLRARLRVTAPYLLHVGNHKPHKNAEGLLKAYQLLHHGTGGKVPPLLLVGGFEPNGELARRAQTMGLGERVRCLGYVEHRELVALYRGAAAFVYPTLYEGFGLPVLEAMACGTPVVAGDTPAVREVAGDGALLVNPRDVVSLAGAIRRVLVQPDLAAQLQERGQARARSFRWRAAAEATLRAYDAAREAA